MYVKLDWGGGSVGGMEDGGGHRKRCMWGSERGERMENVVSREEVVFWIPWARENRIPGPLSPYRFEACTHYQARSCPLTL